MLMIMNNKARACILMHIETKGALQQLLYLQAAKGVSVRKELRKEIKLFELIN